MNEPNPLETLPLDTTTDATTQTPTEQVPPTQQTPPQTLEELLEVKIGGKPFKVTREEAIAGYQRMKDYTQKTMELAESRRTWEAEKERTYKQVEELRTWLSDPQNLMTYYQQLVQQRGFEDPNVPLTAGQAQTVVQSQLAKEREAMKKELEQMRRSIGVETQAAQMLTEVNATIKGLVEANPELKSVDGIEALMYRDVAALHPETLDDVKQGLVQIAKNRAERLRSHFAEQQKATAVQKAKLTQGIEPPGNAGVPAIPPQKYKLGDPALVNAVMQDILAASKGA